MFLWLFAVVVTRAIAKVAAYPQFYAGSKDGCEIPDQQYGNHGSPVQIDTIGFQLVDGFTIVSEWVPSETYTLAVTSYASDPTNAWVHTSAGELSVVDEIGMLARACEQAWHTQWSANTHIVAWTAPPNTLFDPCVTFSTAQATGQYDAYKTNTVEICSMSEGAPGPLDDALETQEALVDTDALEAPAPAADVPSLAPIATDVVAPEAADTASQPASAAVKPAAAAAAQPAGKPAATPGGARAEAGGSDIADAAAENAATAARVAAVLAGAASLLAALV